MKAYINTTDEQGEALKIKIPYSKVKVDNTIFPKHKIIDDYYLVRFDDLHSAYSFDNNICDYYSIKHSTRLSSSAEIYLDDYDNYEELSERKLWDLLIEEFMENGCVYVIMVDSDVLCDGHKCVVTGEDASIVYGKIIFTAQHIPGENVFYLVNGGKDLRASSINRVVCEKRNGYSATVSYAMTNGDTISQADIKTKAGAINWINSKC